MISKVAPTAEIDTFTISYPNDSAFDEADKAKSHAEKLGLKYHQTDISEKDFKKHLTEVVYFLEEPISAPVSLPVFLLAKSMAKDGVVVYQAKVRMKYTVVIVWRLFLKLARFQFLFPRLSRLIFFALRILPCLYLLITAFSICVISFGAVLIRSTFFGGSGTFVLVI